MVTQMAAESSKEIPAEWPVDGVEAVSECPVCSCTGHERVYENLVDHSFQSVPARWSLKKCTGCGSFYLDPRPTTETLPLAYVSYFTHNRRGSERGHRSRMSQVRGSLESSYLNHRFGTHFPNAFPGAHWVIRLLPRLRRHLDVSYARHLQSPPQGRNRLLDVGCGNGDFLRCAQALGWEAEGLDTDPVAAKEARATGCRAWCQDIGSFVEGRRGRYHQLTLSHVIEHVSAPVALLRHCFALLAPGGRLWLETPNLDSFGHAAFGASWRGLEPPRHLVLFNRSSLRIALKAAGFRDLEFKTHPATALFIWETSREIAAKVSPGESGALTRLLRLQPTSLIAEYFCDLCPTRSEFLTCVATRGDATIQFL